MVMCCCITNTMDYEDHVRDFAAQVGVELDDAEVAAYAESAEELAGQFGTLDPSPPDHAQATDVRHGEDEYNAVRYRFTLEGEGGELGDLDVAVKENFAVAGVPMHCGSEALEYEPGHHATVVERLRAAGASLVGTTNMDEFAYFTTGETCAFGPTDNPRAEGRVPGGSSSGSGAAVAGGLVDAAFGSDTGGSVRIPASFCGVVGLKPTHHSISRFGLADLAPSLDQPGPLAADVETVARVYDAVAGPDSHAPATLSSTPTTDAEAGVDDEVDGLTIGVIDSSMAGADDSVADRVDEAISTLATAGVDTERVDVQGYQTATVATLAIAASEFAALGVFEGQLPGAGTGYSDPWRTAVSKALRSPDLGDNVRDQLLTAGALNQRSQEHYVAAQGVATEFAETVDSLLTEFDALLTPTTPMAAPEFGEIQTSADFARTVENTAPFNLSGHPALSVPAGSVNGAPVGVQFVGPRDGERTLMALGSAV